MALLPMAVYGLEVPPGDMAISARPDIPAAFRITMAAIDPSAEPEGADSTKQRSTLKIIRQSLVAEDFYGDSDEDEDEDEDEFDADQMEALLAQDDSEEDEEDDDDEDEDDDEEEEEINGGPSDPAKTKLARKAAAQAEIKKLLEAEGMEIDENGEINGVNGVLKSAKARGKMPITNAGEDDDDSEDDEDDEEGAEIEEFVICTLDPTQQYQQTLDIAIGEDERVWFKVSGTHTIYLTGNYVEPAASYSDSEDEEDDDEMDYDLEPDEDELDEDEELDELDELVDPRVTEVDEEDDEPPTLVQILKKPKQTAAVEKSKGKNKRTAEEEDEGDNLDDLISKSTTNGTAGEQKLSKKQQKKLKKNDGTAVVADTGKDTTKSDKKVAFAKEIEQGPTPSKQPIAADKTKTGLGVKTLQGVTVDDRKIGTGPGAKNGDRVGMRYIGKLKDGKVFDSNRKGRPFSFKLGAGEVIKGWDIGVAGLSVGGERRLTIPPHLAYGSKGNGDIPANSTLIFDLKVIEINKGK